MQWRSDRNGRRSGEDAAEEEHQRTGKRPAPGEGVDELPPRREGQEADDQPSTDHDDEGSLKCADGAEVGQRPVIRPTESPQDQL